MLEHSPIDTVKSHGRSVQLCVFSAVILIICIFLLTMHTNVGRDTLGWSDSLVINQLYIYRVLVVMAQFKDKNFTYLITTLHNMRYWQCTPDGSNTGLYGLCFHVDVILHVTNDADPEPFHVLPKNINITIHRHEPSIGNRLAWLHRDDFRRNVNNYDVFVYQEPDLLITRDSLSAIVKSNMELEPLWDVDGKRYHVLYILWEVASTEESYRSQHITLPNFHTHPVIYPHLVKIQNKTYWQLYPQNDFTLGHAAGCILNRNHLLTLLTNHTEEYLRTNGELPGQLPLERASSAPYWEFNFIKLLPLEEFWTYWIHHQPNNYPGNNLWNQQRIQAMLDEQLQKNEYLTVVP